jgi:acylphosphatase
MQIATTLRDLGRLEARAFCGYHKSLVWFPLPPSSVIRSEMASPACQRCQVFYSGHVQGVGFRYTTSRIAGNFEVTGFVRNLPDGRVELVAEGESQELTAFLQEVAERMANNIRSTAVDRRAATGEFSSFDIRH